jgi:hypothetical protein
MSGLEEQIRVGSYQPRTPVLQVSPYQEEMDQELADIARRLRAKRLAETEACNAAYKRDVLADVGLTGHPLAERVWDVCLQHNLPGIDGCDQAWQRRMYTRLRDYADLVLEANGKEPGRAANPAYWGAETTLGALEPGTLFQAIGIGCIALKSEYTYSGKQNHPLCILVGSGEYAHFEDGPETRVRSVNVIAFEAAGAGHAD